MVSSSLHLKSSLKLSTLVLALSSQISPRQSQREQYEPSLNESNSIEDDIELQQPSFSIAIEDRADEGDNFQLAPPQLSMPLQVGEQTGRSIEIGRRALDDQPLGRVSRGSYGTVRGSDQFDDLSALGLNDVSQPPFEDSVLQTTPDADEEDHGSFDRRLSLRSVVI